ncbi:hypothetical protein AB0J85_28600 [Micromonospora echinofusca]|uniref:hypothetical protein n=1 Tax=Micromonospora echinofusca TaxID=47858 RepID=UPI0034461FAF
MSAGGSCFRTGDEDGELTARQSPPGGTLCFHPADKGDEPVVRTVWPGGGGGAACFHPGDGDGAPTARFADDLAADLHLALTSIDDRQLALLG